MDLSKEFSIRASGTKGIKGIKAVRECFRNFRQARNLEIISNTWQFRECSIEIIKNRFQNRKKYTS